MKFICKKNDLYEVINNVSQAVSPKSNIPALEGISIKNHNNVLTLTGYNLELGITKDIEVKTINDGELILNASLFSSIINKMPDDEIEISSDEKLLTKIKCNEIKFTILGINIDEFPEIPITSSIKSFDINSELLKSMLSQTLFAISQNDINPVHTGALFEITDNILTIVTIDGFRLALRKEKIDTTVDNNKFIVPGKTLNEILKLLSKMQIDDDLKICIAPKHITFIIDGYTIISRLLEGEFLDYKKTISNQSNTLATVNVKDFTNAINRASIIINERAKSPIICEFNEDRINIFCETTMGKINDFVGTAIDGENVKIAFNNRYMIDALKACDVSEILIKMNGSLSPMKITPIDNENFLFLVLPVRI